MFKTGFLNLYKKLNFLHNKKLYFIFLIFFIPIFLSQCSKKNNKSLIKIPKTINIKSIPGNSSITKNYENLQNKENSLKAQEAFLNGKSLIPTINKSKKNAKEINQLKFNNISKLDINNNIRKKSNLLFFDEKNRRRILNIENNMFHQIKDILIKKNIPIQKFAVSNFKIIEKKNKMKKKILIKSGTILIGNLDTSIKDIKNSPVLVSILDERFNNSKIIGYLTSNNNKDKVLLKFNVLSIPNFKKSFKINAIAIDLKSEKSYIYSPMINNHYFKNSIVSIFSILLENLSASIKPYPNIVLKKKNDSTKIFYKGGLSYKDKILYSVSKFGNGLSRIIKNNFKSKPNILVNSGEKIGILFENDVIID